MNAITSLAEIQSDCFSTELATSVFNEAPESKFWLGIVASHDMVMRPEEYRSARVLRANVYIDDCKFLPESAREADGGESDIDDNRATHFVAIENTGNRYGNVAGNIRLITKQDEADILPVERLFPEAFEETSAPTSAVEASRFIVKHPDKLVHGSISLALIRAAVSHAINGDKQPIYAVVEEPLQRRFEKVGLPHDIIAEARPLEEYNHTKNMAVRFEPLQIIAAAEADHSNELMITPFFQTAAKNSGIGTYGDYLIEPSA